MLSVEIIPVLRDNYSYFIRDKKTKVSGIVDPASAEPILRFLGDKKLDYILNTHHHWDHTNGNIEIKKNKRAQIIGAIADKHRIPGIDIPVENQFKFGNYTVEVLLIPGHTFGHIAFFFREDKILFCGDTLFIGGCGKIFEGTIKQMYESLKLIKQLPDETIIYCGHEYTRYNLRFALSLEASNPELKKAYKNAKILHQKSEPTVPSSIAQEKLINPFFRLDSKEIRDKLNMKNKTNLEVFKKIRSLKDFF